MGGGAGRGAGGGGTNILGVFRGSKFWISRVYLQGGSKQNIFLKIWQYFYLNASSLDFFLLMD